MIPMTRDDGVALVNQTITSSRTTRTHSTNIQCIEQMEADEDACLPTPGMKTPTHSGNLDSNSRKVTGWRITTISDRANHPSKTKHIGTGTRRLILDHTVWPRP